MTTNRLACDSRHVFSHSSGGQMSEIKVSAGPCSLWRIQGRTLPCPSSCWWWPAILGVLWFVDASPASASVFTCCFSLCVSPPLIRTLVILDLGLTLIQYDLILPNYIHKDPNSKSGHILRFQVDMNFGGDNFLTACISISTWVKCGY